MRRPTLALGAPAFAEAGSPRAFWIGLAVVSLSLVSALATYLILTGLTWLTPRFEVVVSVLFVNILLIVAMIAVITWQVRELWRAWRNEVPGARLHIRIVALFSTIAALPALLLAVAATTTFSRSLDGWFSARTRQIVENSLQVVRTYLEEHGQVIRTDIVNMAKDIDDAADQVRTDPAAFRTLLVAQAGLRDLPVAYVIDAAGRPRVTAIEDPKVPYLPPSPEGIAQAAAGQIAVLSQTSAYRVSAIARLARHPDSFLYVSRGVNPQIITQLRSTEQSVAEYQRLRQARGGLKLAHGLMYLMISMTAMLAAIWIGMWFAGRFVAPIRRLIGAAQDVSRGNLTVELPVVRGEGDLRRLSETFNDMTHELKVQRDALVSTNEQLSERRRFMEAVLSGVSAGVLGVGPDGRITIANRSAEKLLGMTAGDLVDKPVREAVPVLGALLDVKEEPQIKARTQHQASLTVGDEERTFAVRVTREDAGGEAEGSVITFDDVTELVSAQRTSAWADVARRIAHEIKNPLTPIQLSAERIRRKYGRLIAEDRETFDKLTETIERQAGHIKSMVDEFASFARMPKPEMLAQDLREAVQEAVVLFRESHPAIEFVLDQPKTPVLMMLDRRLVSQALTNLVKNAAESIESVAASGDAEPGYKGLIETRITALADRAVIEVIDNGTGLARQNRSRLLEPYVTTKAKGTGLGLAIVQKIVEQHAGMLALEDAPVSPRRKRGALVRITLPVRRATGSGESGEIKPAAE